MSKIPIFLHIPKCGGTYVLSWAISIFKSWTRKQGIENERCSISVKHNNSTIFTVLACVRDYANFKINPANKYNFIIDLDGFFSELSKKEIKIFFIMIEPHGFFAIKDKTMQSVCDLIEKSPIYYMTMRDSFLRCQSLYNYLNHKNSNHESSHGAIKSTTLEDHLRSQQLEDSWLIRALIGGLNNQRISENHFNEACAILDEVKIKDIQHIDSLIDEIFENAYALSRKDLSLREITVNKNETNTLKILFSELKSETQEIFLKRTKFDRKLYSRYCK